MQIKTKEITVLTPDGDFIKMKKEQKEYHLGEEITINVHEPGPIRVIKGGWKIKTLVSVLAAVLLFVLSFMPALFSNSKVSAYISMDVKSSIELGITEDLKVVEVKGINQEGKQIVDKLKKWKGRDLEEVINEMVALNDRAGHLKSNPNILFSTVMVEDSSQLESSLHKKIKAVKHIPQVQDTVNVEMKKATIQDRKEASENGVSTGTYLEQSKNNSSTHTSTGNTEKEDEAASVVKTSTPFDTRADQTNKKQESGTIYNDSVNVEYSPVSELNKQDVIKEIEKEISTENRKNANHVANEKSKANSDYNNKRKEQSKNSQPSNKKGTKEQNQIEQKAKQQKVQQQKTKQQIREPDPKKPTINKQNKRQADLKRQSERSTNRNEKEERMDKRDIHNQKQNQKRPD